MGESNEDIIIDSRPARSLDDLIPGAEKIKEDAGTDVMAVDGTQEASGAAVADGDGARQ